jgi:hypothetical protein
LQKQQEREEKEKERQFELNKLKLIQEQQLVEKGVQQEAERVQADFTLCQQELEIRRQNSETQSSNLTISSNESTEPCSFKKICTGFGWDLKKLLFTSNVSRFS